MKNPKLRQQQEVKRELAILMLHKTEQPNRSSDRFCSFAQAARVLGVTYGQVYHWSQQARKMKSPKLR